MSVRSTTRAWVWPCKCAQNQHAAHAVVCPHTTVCVLILLYVSSYHFMCPHTTMCPHITIGVLILLYVSSYHYIYVLIPSDLPLYMCPHTTIYMSTRVLALRATRQTARERERERERESREFSLGLCLRTQSLDPSSFQHVLERLLRGL